MKSATHSWFGRVAVKSRSTRSAGPGVVLGSAIVVRTLLAAQRPGPALLAHQPLDRAPGHVVALARAAAATSCGPRTGAVTGSRPARPAISAIDLGVAQRPLEGARADAVVVGATGRSWQPCSVSTRADRLDPEHLAVLVDELD